MRLWVGLSGVFFALSTVVIYGFTYRITRPIKQLTAQAETVAAGERSVRVAIGSRDELGRLAGSLNRMLASLEDNEIALRQKVAETKTLYEIAKEVSGQVALDSVLRLIMERARDLLRAEQGLLALRQGETDTFAIQAASGAASKALARVRFRPGEGLGGRVVMTGLPLRTANAPQEYPDNPVLKAAQDLEMIRSVVAVPLRSQDRVIGVLCVHSPTPNKFHEDDERLLSALADQAAIAIEKAKLYEQVSQYARELETKIAAFQESEMRFRSVAQSANGAIISADSYGTIIAWNQEAQRIFGYEEAEVLGQPVTLLMPKRYRVNCLSGQARLRAGGEAHVLGKTVELYGLRKDGSEFPLEISLASWQTSAGTFFTSIIRDITEHKRAEAALRES
jgi:PAS domain S-box-containing protein